MHQFLIPFLQKFSFPVNEHKMHQNFLITRNIDKGRYYVSKVVSGSAREMTEYNAQTSSLAEREDEPGLALVPLCQEQVDNKIKMLLEPINQQLAKPTRLFPALTTIGTQNKNTTSSSQQIRKTLSPIL